MLQEHLQILLGVIATKPATPPDIAPRTVGLPTMIVSKIVQTIKAAAAATFDTIIAFAARPFAPKPDPPLNTIHPNHRSASPNTAYPKLCDNNEMSFLLPNTSAIANAEKP